MVLLPHDCGLTGERTGCARVGSWEWYNRIYRYLRVDTPAWPNLSEPKVVRKRGHMPFGPPAFAALANPLRAQPPPVSESSQTSSTAESSGASTDGMKHQRRDGSAVAWPEMRPSLGG